MKKSLVLLILFSGLLITEAVAQVTGPVPSPYNAIRQNGISNMAATGDTLWAGPKLNRNIGNAPEWYFPENADSVAGGKGRVFSYALRGDTVITGLGFTGGNNISGPEPAGYGYYISTDGGEQWRFSDFPLDEDPPSKCISTSADYVPPSSPDDYDPDCDITFRYGGNEYSRTRITVPEQSVPYNTAFKGDVIFSAVFASGLIRSTDFGDSWERIILPPSGRTELSPENEYSWNSTFRYFPANSGSETATINRYDPLADLNLRGFSVYIDSQDRVWYGSAGGINVSGNALSAPTDSISWNLTSFDNTPDGLSGNWIIEIEEDPATGYIWMTNWIATSPQKYALVYTKDGGETFTRVLRGEKINNVGFKDGYVFAAGDNGLFISEDGGNTWIQNNDIRSPNQFIKKTAAFNAIAVTNNRVWIGTDDGIASTGDYGDTWEITRTNFPLKGGNVYEPDAGNTDAYAYPNPFSPSVYEVVRIKFETKEKGNVKVRIFDFGMNLVREVENSTFQPGTYEAVWNGQDRKGRQAANGPYIYVIEKPDGEVSGKIMLID